MQRGKKHGFHLLCILFVFSVFLVSCGNPGAGGSSNLNDPATITAKSEISPAAANASEPGFTVLHSFAGGAMDGTNPGELIMDNKGNLYGTTYFGGAFDMGTVFKLDASGTLTLLHSFAGGTTDGFLPYGRLVMDNKGNLYGTTTYQGAFSEGTIFKLDTNCTVTLVHSFAGYPTEGANPESGIIMDNKGNVYGTTGLGDSYTNPNQGTIYKLDTNGTLTLLHTFVGGTADGDNPYTDLIMDNKGNLYGTTISGGAFDKGTVYKLDSSGTLTLLHSFAGYPTDGAYPESVIMDNKGNLYGVTSSGGAFDKGTVYKFDSSGTLSLLHTFAGIMDGSGPSGLIMDNKGNLYGGTSSGGAFDKGTVYKFDSSGTLTLLHTFAGGTTDGSLPHRRLFMDNKGNLYGTTFGGGSYSKGTVFKLTLK